MSKILTKEIARKHIGEYVDMDKRLFHYFPLKIIIFNDGSGEIGLKDRIGVCTHIDPRPYPNCNSVYYDYIFKMVEDTKDGESNDSKDKE